MAQKSEELHWIISTIWLYCKYKGNASFEKKTTQSASCLYFSDLNVNIRIFGEESKNSYSI